MFRRIKEFWLKPGGYPFVPDNIRKTSAMDWLRKIHAWTGIWGAVASILFGVSTIALLHPNFIPSGQPSVDVRSLAVGAASIESSEQLAAFLKQELNLATEPVQQAAGGGRRGGAGQGGAGGGGQGAVAANDGAAAAGGGEHGQGAAAANDGAADAGGGHSHGAAAAGDNAAGAGGGGGGMGRRGAGADNAAGAGGIVRRPTHRALFSAVGHSLAASYVEGNQFIEITETRQSLVRTMNLLHLGRGARDGWTVLGDIFSASLILMCLTGFLLWNVFAGSRLLGLSVFGAGLFFTLYFVTAGV